MIRLRAGETHDTFRDENPFFLHIENTDPRAPHLPRVSYAGVVSYCLRLHPEAPLGVIAMTFYDLGEAEFEVRPGDMVRRNDETLLQIAADPLKEGETPCLDVVDLRTAHQEK